MKNYRTNRQRITALLLSLSCILCTAGCTDKGPDSAISSAETSGKSSEASAAEESEESPDLDLSFPGEEEPFELPELSDEIPAEAVTKVTISETKGDETRIVRVEYNDEHDHPLLLMEPDSDNVLKAARNYRYKYNDNGDYTYEWELSESSLNETTTEYDSENRYTAMKCTKNGKLSWESRYEYDKYGNLLLNESTYYDDTTGEIMSVFTDDFSDCDYDSEGNLITAREHKSDGSLSKTYSYTYNSEGQRLTEKAVKEDFDPDDDYQTTETKYEYVPDNKLPSLEETVKYKKDGSVYSTVIIEREFDDSGRVTQATKTYKDSSTQNVIKQTFEYEAL